MIFNGWFGTIDGGKILLSFDDDWDTEKRKENFVQAVDREKDKLIAAQQEQLSLFGGVDNAR